jgi:hypothetical protein
MKTLSKTEIRALYGAIGKKGEVVAYGRSVENAMTSAYRAQVEADARTMSRSELWQKHGDYLSKLKTTPSAPVLESQVAELTF